MLKVNDANGELPSGRVASLLPPALLPKLHFPPDFSVRLIRWKVYGARYCARNGCSLVLPHNNLGNERVDFLLFFQLKGFYFLRPLPKVWN
jgi:hypothetical protein